MKKIKFNRFIFILFFPIFTFPQNWQLVWQEEFFGPEIDQNNWTHEIGGGGWGNNELQYYTDRSENSYIEDGKLVIEALQENYGGRNYTSARIITKDKQSWQYGRVEARIKLPYGQGLWPAFWMLGDNINSVSWPRCGEIDIMEMIGGNNGDKTVYGTAHWDNNGVHASYGNSYSISNGIFADEYHLFRIEWNPQNIKWFVDGYQYNIIDITPEELSEFHQKFFLILNIAVGGDWPGSPDGTTVFPQKMYVDYIRYYADASAIPEISIISPENNSIIEPNSNVNIATEVNFDGEIEKVEFFQDAMKIGESTVNPYKMNWTGLSPGCYQISAKARSVSGYVGSSGTVNLQVGDECVEAPYYGKPFKIPGEIEVENFNIGDAGIAYYDSDLINNGGKYRLNNQVDIETCDDIYGGYNIGWIEAGEWIKYFINVQNSAVYNFEFRVASENSGGALHVEIDNVNVTGTVNVNSTGGWQVWENLEVNDVSLPEGFHELKIVFESGNFNLNRIDVFEPNTQSSIEIISPNGGELLGIGTIQEITWNSLKIKNVAIGLSIDGGNNWSFVAESTPAFYGFYQWLVPNVQSDNCLIMIIDAENSTIQSVSDSIFSIDVVDEIGEQNYEVANFKLYQNYPNPFSAKGENGNQITIIKFSIPNNQENVSLTTLRVYNLLGQQVAELLNKPLSAGIYSVEFNASSLNREIPSGIYLYELASGKKRLTKKLILIK